MSNNCRRIGDETLVATWMNNIQTSGRPDLYLDSKGYLPLSIAAAVERMISRSKRDAAALEGVKEHKA